jgi:hypothetical protein
MTRHSILAVLVLAAVFSWPVHAAKTYTPQQLRKMVESGNLPKQGSPTTQTQSIPFPSCVAKVSDVIESVKAQYPTKIIVQTKVLHMAKVWTNDGAMTLSCSQPDGKLVITNAKYL